MSISLVSFSYRSGAAPRDADIVLDCRDLPNPYHHQGLKARNGKDAIVQLYILSRDEAGVEDMIFRAIRDVPPGGKIAAGCVGGRHRSVAVIEMLADHLRAAKKEFTISHTAL